MKPVGQGMLALQSMSHSGGGLGREQTLLGGISTERRDSPVSQRRSAPLPRAPVGSSLIVPSIGRMSPSAPFTSL
jgi:hypothetical protein